MLNFLENIEMKTLDDGALSQRRNEWPWTRNCRGRRDRSVFDYMEHINKFHEIYRTNGFQPVVWKHP